MGTTHVVDSKNRGGVHQNLLACSTLFLHNGAIYSVSKCFNLSLTTYEKNMKTKRVENRVPDKISPVDVEIALCTDLPHQSDSCLSTLQRNPALCVALGVVLCAISVAVVAFVVAGVVLLGVGILSVCGTLLFVLAGLTGLLLFAVGITLVCQGILYRLPTTPEDITAYIEKRSQIFGQHARGMENMAEQYLLTRTHSSSPYLMGYQQILHDHIGLLKSHHSSLSFVLERQQETAKAQEAERKKPEAASKQREAAEQLASSSSS